MRVVALLAVLAIPLFADTVVSVQATTEAGQSVSNANRVSFSLLAPASALLELDYSGLGCSPFPSCNDFQHFDADLQSSALPFIYSISIGGSGVFIDPSANCEFGMGFNSFVCDHLQLPSGNYTLSVYLGAQSSGTPELPGSSVAKVTIVGNAPVVITPLNRCDINGDGRNDITDVQTIVNQVLSGNPPSSSDINGDGAVNVADVQRVVNAVLGLGCVTQ